MAPYFSIILPVYNVESYLERCVSSVLSQSFSDFEILLVDDGSTDKSPALCDDLARQHSGIRVIHKENGGLSSARNGGMEAAQGQYIWFVDSDDWIEQNALEKLYRQTSGETPDMVKFDYIRVEEQSAPVHSNAAPGSYTGDDMLQRLLDRAFFSAGKFVLSACTHIYRRDFLRQNGLTFVSERLVGSEDYLFNLQALVLARSVTVIRDTLYYYERRNGSLTQQYKKDLPRRYGVLYETLTESYRKAALLEKYQGKLAAFYLWHLLRGTCIPNEYYVTKSHSLRQGRRNIRAYLAEKPVRQAYALCDKKAFSRKDRLQLWAMINGLEPVFYWLYVVKPGIKKGFRNENQAKNK